MRRPDQRLPRDGLVLLAWLATTAGLVLLEPLMHLRRQLRPRRALPFAPSANPAGGLAELARLDRVAERGVWRSEALHVMHADAADAIEAAEDDFEAMLAQCAQVMRLPVRGPVRDIAPETEFVFQRIAA